MRAEPVIAYIGLGANLGAAEQAVTQALLALDALPGTRLVRRSSLYRSAPHEASGPEFITAPLVVGQPRGIGGRLRPLAPELLAALQGLELAAGRERPYFHAPRTLDLDLLTYGDGRIESPHLTVPHPRITERAFVLLPWAEIAPDRVRPEHLARLSDQEITKIQGI